MTKVSRADRVYLAVVGVGVLVGGSVMLVFAIWPTVTWAQVDAVADRVFAIGMPVALMLFGLLCLLAALTGNSE